MSEREYQRARLLSEVIIVNGSTPEIGKAVNISLGGMYLKTKRSRPIGSAIELSIVMPSDKKISIVGSIIRNTTHQGEDLPAGLGVKFDNLSIDSRAEIECYVRMTFRVLKALFFELNRAKINKAKVRELTAQSLIKHQYPMDILREKVASELAGLKLRAKTPQEK